MTIPPGLPLWLALAATAFFLTRWIIEWRRCTRLWRAGHTPIRNANPPGPAELAIFILALLGGLGALGIPGAASPALAGALAALTTLGIAHRAASISGGGVGLALAAATLVCICEHYVWPAWPGVAIGAAVAAAWMFWLAAFWRQQLHDGRPWTTTGRLIAAARYVGAVAAISAIAAAIASFRASSIST